MISCMAELSYEKLTEAELASALAGLPGWSVEGGMLSRSFEFGSYAAGLVFAVAVGHEAERLNHHPDLVVGYQRVVVSLVTHDAGGLTSYDVELARRVSVLA